MEVWTGGVEVRSYGGLDWRCGVVEVKSFKDCFISILAICDFVFVAFVVRTEVFRCKLMPF